MEKYIVFSDSHNSGYRRMLKVLEREAGYAGVFFLGDGEYDANKLQNQLGAIPFYRVSGNCDFGSDYPSDGLLPLGGNLVFYTHGHKQGVKTGLGGLYLEAMRSGANSILFGHTHIAYNKLYEDCRFFNPGSITQPRTGYPSYGRITVPGGGKPLGFELVDVKFL